MGGTTRSIVVERPFEEAAASLEQVDEMMALIREFGRTKFISAREDGSQEWDVFIVLGTMYMGGRVAVTVPQSGVLTWRSISGIANSTYLEAIPHEDGTLLMASVKFHVDGVLTGPLAGWLLRGIVGRYVDALLERLRHRIEYGE